MAYDATKVEVIDLGASMLHGLGRICSVSPNRGWNIDVIISRALEFLTVHLDRPANGQVKNWQYLAFKFTGIANVSINSANTSAKNWHKLSLCDSLFANIDSRGWLNGRDVPDLKTYRKINWWTDPLTCYVCQYQPVLSTSANKMSLVAYVGFIFSEDVRINWTLAILCSTTCRKNATQQSSKT